MNEELKKNTEISEPSSKPANPFLVTPAGIAMNCKLDGTVV